VVGQEEISQSPDWNPLLIVLITSLTLAGCLARRRRHLERCGITRIVLSIRLCQENRFRLNCSNFLLLLSTKPPCLVGYFNGLLPVEAIQKHKAPAVTSC